MRRAIITGTALAVLAGGAVAYAASTFNSYTATETFSPSKAGTAKAPSPFAMHELWIAKGEGGHSTAPLTKIISMNYGVVTNGKDFPVCTASMINTAGNTKGWNKVCPKGSVIGQGPVNSTLVSPAAPTSSGSPCNPYLYVYNGGQGTQVFFFTEYPFAPGTQYSCVGGAIKTGAAPAYNGYITSKHGFEVVTIPLPTTVSTNAGGVGLYASLEKLNVQYAKMTTKVKGKTVAYQASVACKHGSRPYSTTFYATNYVGQSPSTQVTTVAHSAKC